MSERIVPQEEYDRLRSIHTDRGDIKNGWFYLALRTLHTANANNFARQLSVKITGVQQHDEFSTVSMQELDDEGRELPGADKQVYVSGDGFIVDKTLHGDTERGYLVLGKEPAADGFNLTWEQLAEPVYVAALRKTQVNQQQVQQGQIEHS